MWNKPSKAQLAKVPALYTSEHLDCKDKIIYLHFFIDGCDWYVAEFDGEDLFFGYVNLNDPFNAEWGYFSLKELDAINVKGIEIDTDLHWQATKFSEIANQGARVATREYFTKREALEKVGKIVETLVTFSGVPKGNTGTVARIYNASKDTYGVDIQWHLKSQKPVVAEGKIGGESFVFVQTNKPLMDGFSKTEYEKFLKEVAE